MVNDTFIQVATDGAGKKVRNLSVPVLQSDGTLSTAYMQVTALAKSDGTLMDLDIKTTLESLLLVAKQQRMLLLLLVNAVTNSKLTADDLKPLNET